MSEKLKAISLGYIKYSESSLILYVYSLEYGYLSLMLKGFFNKKKKNKAILYPLTEITFILPSNADKNKLINIYSVDILNYFDDIFSHPIKSLQIQLIAEFLKNTFKEEPLNRDLYEYILKALKNFSEKKDNFADFHLIFFKEIISLFGLKPMNNPNNNFFNLKEGNFLESQNYDYSIGEEESLLFKKLLHQEFTLTSETIFNQKERRILLDILFKYFEFHLSNFRSPQSLEILKHLIH